MDLAAKVEELIKLTTSLKQELNELRGKDLNTRLQELEKEMAELKNEINELKYCLMKQNANILAMIHRLPKLQEIQEMREKVNDTKLMSANPRVVIQHNISNYSKIFPLASLADLEQLEQSLDEINTQEIVLILQRLLMPKGIAKNLHFVLSEELVWECNLDGKRNKTRLLGYSKFIDALFQAVYIEGYGLKTFMSDLRRGMKLIKKRHSKLKSLSKSGKKRPKSQSKLQESEEEFEYDSNDYDDDDDEDQMPQAELIIKVEDTILGGN